MASKIYIYKTDLDPTKNQVLDDVEAYLSLKTPVYSNTNFQYIKPALETSIKVDIVTRYDWAAVQTGNFVKVVQKANQYDSEHTYYYFITAAEWVADYTARFTLALDTLNTWWDEITSKMNAKTHITRQHKDRFVPTDDVQPQTFTISVSGSGTTTAISQYIYRYSGYHWNADWAGCSIDSFDITTNDPQVGIVSGLVAIDSEGEITLVFQAGSHKSFSYTGTITLNRPISYFRKIDTFSEGVNPVLFGEDKGNFDYDNGNNWYLIYKGSTNIKCYLAPENPITVNFPSGTDTYSATDLTGGKYYFVTCDVDNYSREQSYSVRIITSNNNWYYNLFSPAEPASVGKIFICFYKDGNNIKIRKLIYKIVDSIYDVTATEWETCTSITFYSKEAQVNTLTTTSYSTDPDDIYAGDTVVFQINQASYQLKTFDTLDRYDDELIKIIKLPYLPVDIPGPAFAYDTNTGFLEISDLNATLNKGYTSSDLNPLSELTLSFIPLIVLPHSKQFESKLYQSSFYQPKFVYDSFSKKFDLERINLDSYTASVDSPFEFNFMSSNTVNSRFLFTFPQYATNEKQLEDYDNILIVSRNNEVPIFNSTYMNYIKTGYNYDVKAKNIQTATTIGTTLLSTAGSAALLALGASGGNPVAAIVGTAVGLAGGIISVVSQTQASANSIDQKEAQYKNQATSVRSADDVDLLTFYTDNKAKYMLYKPSEQMEDALYNIFRLTGYACDEYAIPDFTTRYYYNFVQCDPQFDQLNLTVYNDYIDEIKARFQLGVTVFHVHSGAVDINQEKENWETSLL